MRWNTWIVFVVTEAILSMTPGPAVLLVISSGLRGGVRHGVSAGLGILGANAMYFAVSATSLGAMLAASAGLYVVVKWIGAAYLVYLGARHLFSRTAARNEAGNRMRDRRALANGFLLQASNPKAIVFFVALLPQFLDRSFSIPWQVAILGVSSIAVEFVILLGYSAVAGRASHLVRNPRYAALTQRVGGAMLILAGAGLAVITR